MKKKNETSAKRSNKIQNAFRRWQLERQIAAASQLRDWCVGLRHADGQHDPVGAGVEALQGRAPPPTQHLQQDVRRRVAPVLAQTKQHLPGQRQPALSPPLLQLMLHRGPVANVPHSHRPVVAAFFLLSPIFCVF